MERVTLEISWASLWRILFFVVFVTILFLGRQVLLGVFLAIVISSGLESAINFLERRGIPRSLGVIFVFLLAVAILVVVIYAVIPRLLLDLRTISLSIAGPGERAWLRSIFSFQTSHSFEDWINRVSYQFSQSNLSPLQIFSGILGGVALAISVFVVSFYLSLSHDGIERFIRAVLPENAEEVALRIYARSKRKIGLWFRTQIILNIVMGTIVWISLLILGVQNAFLIGVLAGIFELVPFVGPILSGAAAVLSALTTAPGYGLALLTLVVFLVLHQFEAHVLVPLLMRRSVGLHPVIVIVALLIGVEVGGFLGILIAVPAAAVIQEVLEDWSSARKNRRPNGE